MTFRGFVAVDLPPTDALDRFTAALRDSGGSLRVIDPRQVHVTLKFLGETEEGLADAIIDALRRSTQDVHPFRVRIVGTGCFPSRSRIHVVWVGMEDPGPLPRIAGRLDAELEPLGFPRDRRPFSPHVTIARVKTRRNLDGVRRAMDAFAVETFGEHDVRDIRLKKSVLSPEGATYSTVGRVELHPSS